jgi:hypothetical protein
MIRDDSLSGGSVAACVESTVEYAIKNNKTLSLKTHSYLPKERRYIDDVLHRYLEEEGLSCLQNKISYCIHELAGNAKKANTKRVYFAEKKLDILDPGHYELGMKNFKMDTIENIPYFIQLQKAADLFIKFQFRRSENRLSISIRNNTSLTEEESRRINDKISLSKTISSIPEAYGLLEDSSEGAGLGIVMMIMMLRSIGFSDDVLDISCKNGETVAELKLDVNMVIPDSAMEGDGLIA